MKFPSKEQLECLSRRYPTGLRLELIEMVNDPIPVLPGTLGTVVGIGIDGSIGMVWDNGRTLSLLPDAGDRFKRV